jgi:hypothetical protein
VDGEDVIKAYKPVVLHPVRPRLLADNQRLMLEGASSLTQAISGISS